MASDERQDEIRAAIAGRLRLAGLTITVTPAGADAVEVVLSDGQGSGRRRFDLGFYDLEPRLYLDGFCFELVVNFAANRYLAS